MYRAQKSFQLHHIGIKTYDMRRVRKVARVFQLHHIGIKTSAARPPPVSVVTSNCTI